MPFSNVPEPIISVSFELWFWFDALHEINIKDKILIPTVFEKNNNYNFEDKIYNYELPKLKIKLLKKKEKQKQKPINLYTDIEDNLEEIKFLDPYLFFDHSDFLQFD